MAALRVLALLTGSRGQRRLRIAGMTRRTIVEAGKGHLDVVVRSQVCKAIHSFYCCMCCRCPIARTYRACRSRAHCICRCHTDITLPRPEPNRFDCACAVSIRMYHTPTPACGTNGSHWGGRLMQKTGFIKQQLDDTELSLVMIERIDRLYTDGCLGE